MLDFIVKCLCPVTDVDSLNCSFWLNKQTNETHKTWAPLVGSHIAFWMVFTAGCPSPYTLFCCSPTPFHPPCAVSPDPPKYHLHSTPFPWLLRTSLPSVTCQFKHRSNGFQLAPTYEREHAGLPHSARLCPALPIYLQSSIFFAATYNIPSCICNTVL